ncbi:MAG: site-2 protease family protein [Candidatus Microsaccharimonas sossegonensis]|uniref:Site-2 protease family protein n=1 Tax=Candidatus Microsaccharimonas sossegonensis TaxID=2506948 RepID=A0A4Q0AH40_9BACT|nr:MAG: site-2 protease family protein [Candidatus Microsaccharimonas sossegonensis]
MDFIVSIIIVLGILLLSMTLHEAMHGFIAFWLGDDTAKREGRLTLNPIKHLDPFLSVILPLALFLVGAPVFGGAKPVPFNPDRVKGEEWGAALVAAAGPITNLVIAFITFGIWAVLGAPGASSLAGQILITAYTINLGFFIFNSIPIPPLDGSRVMYALAPDFVRTGMRAIERYGIIFVFAIVLLFNGVIGKIILTVMNFFIGVFAGIFQV